MSSTVLAQGGEGLIGVPVDPVSFPAGTTTAVSAPVLTSLGAVSGTALQLSDLTRDYMVYLECTTSGTATSIMASAAATAGVVYSFRLPAGWYLKWTGTTTAFATQNAVGC